jgi:hypothetical protein
MIPLKRRINADSAYLKPCPACDAKPLHHCVSRSGERVNIHCAREMQVPVEPLPDLRDWWRSMKPYEGKYAKPRPAGLVVP